jgi:hypothetical protein
MSSWRISDFSHNDASVSKFKQAAFDDICELFDHGKRRHTFVVGRRLNLKDITCPSIQPPAKLPSTT